MRSPLILNEDPATSGLPFAEARAGRVIDERALIERRLAQSEERAAWARLREIGTILAA